MYQVRPRPTLEGRYPLPPRRPALRSSLHRQLAGLGTTQTMTTANEISGISGAGISIVGIAKSGAPLSTQIEASAASALFSAAPYSGPAAPFLVAAGAVAELLAVFGVGSGCGQTCVLSTTYANKAEQIFELNIKTYFGLPAPRTDLQKSNSLIIFDTVLADLVKQCSNPALGDAGKACISDRQSGACKWHQTGQPEFPGQPAYGACWNWVNAYRDPIAKDVTVADTLSTTTSSLLSSLTGGASSSTLWLMAGAALLFIGLAGDN